MPHERIQVYANPSMKRRIELAATKRNVSVTRYCLEAIRQQLAADNMLEEREVTIPVEKTKATNLIADLRALQHEIKTSRGGNLIDVDAVIEQVREEREHELLGMC